ncbi:class I SAM-dependent methyltransferase [Cesiribacter andamanensis]|nr:class I SAM-dependent methyltransferase [Cesiribacter andamanensis]
MCGDETSGHKVLGQRMNKSQGLNPKANSGITTSVLQCTNCKLIYSNPQPIPFDIQDHYGVPPEAYWKEEYFTHHPEYFASEIAIAKRLLPEQQGLKALDIGAGLGKCMLSLQNAGFDVWGLEPSIPFREKAIDKMGIRAERLSQGMMEELDYPASFFDFITFGAVLEHLYQPAASIERALGWLKPGGIIQIEVPSSEHFMPSLLNFYYRLKGTNYVTNLSPMHEPFHLYEFSLRSFQELAKKLPFEIAFHEYHVCDIFHIPKVLHPLFSWYMAKTNKGMQLSVWLRKK